ncbi:MAG TPA: hypothetical protein VIJ23_06945, partial [Mycobacterium sp.]
MRRSIHRYLQYLDRHGSVAQRLCAAAVPAWVVHGETGDGGITDEERRTLQAYPWIRVVTIPGPQLLHPQRGSLPSSPGSWSQRCRPPQPGRRPTEPASPAR